MFKFFIFIFLGLFVNMNDVYSEFFMPQNARSDTTSVNNIRAISRIPNNSKSNYEAKKTFANKKQVIKQKTPRKLFMATQSEVQKKENVNSEEAQSNKTLGKAVIDTSKKTSIIQKKDNIHHEDIQLNPVLEKTVYKTDNNLSIHQEENKGTIDKKDIVVNKTKDNKYMNIFDKIEAEYKDDLIKISKGSYKGNPRINKVISDFRDEEHRI